MCMEGITGGVEVGLRAPMPEKCPERFLRLILQPRPQESIWEE